jgi:hypothetical protein
MSDLRDILRHAFGRFGRPSAEPTEGATDAHVEAIDKRLDVLERHVSENKARLRLLEIQADPQGRLHHE